MLVRLFARNCCLPSLCRTIQTSIFRREKLAENVGGDSSEMSVKRQSFTYGFSEEDRPTVKILKYMYREHPKRLSLNDLFNYLKFHGIKSKRHLRDCLRVCREANYIKTIPVRSVRENKHVYALKVRRHIKLARILDLRRPLREVLCDQTPL